MKNNLKEILRYIVEVSLIVIIPLSIIGIIGCSVQKDTFKMTEMEIKKSQLKSDGWNILKGDDCIARVESIEWEYYKGDFTREVSITLLDLKTFKEIEEIVKFMHTKFPDSKIEVNRDKYFEELNKDE